MALSEEEIATVKRDDEKEYDVKFGEDFRARHKKDSYIPPSQIAGSEPLNELLDLIMEEAIDLEARNIEVSLDSDGYGLVEFRLGRYIAVDRILDKDAVYGLTVVARKRAGINIENEFKSTIGGKITHEYMNQKHDIRCAFINSIQGMTMSLRILYPTSKLLDISGLGLPENVESVYRESLRANQGLILITGATGSGKTTTQISGLSTIQEEFKNQKNIRTLENPVEYTLSRVKQTQVNEEDGETFAKLLQMLFRGDPDVILLGEINDSETAQTANRASTSGHLVLSTLHTNNTIEVTRVMQQYGVSYIDLGKALQLVINQELEDKLCETCRKIRPINADESHWVQRRLGIDDVITVVYDVSGEIDGEKCTSCNGNGYKGATLIVEMLEANYAYQNALNEAKDNTIELEKLLLNDPDANYYPIGRDVFRHLKLGNINMNTAQRVMKKQTGEIRKIGESEKEMVE